METLLWSLLLLLCLGVPGHCDCKRDCLPCGLLFPKKQAFSTLACLVECEDRASPGLTWDLCHRYGEFLESRSLPAEVTILKTILKKAIDEVPTLTPVDLENEGQAFSEALQRFHHAARALGLNQIFDPHHLQQLRTEEEEEKEEEGGVANEDLGNDETDRNLQEVGVRMSKRFGGFLKGKYGYRKLMGPSRPLQKRYGGFIGIRKSARKWHSQKRFSELLKQYLGMRTRSAELNGEQSEM